MVDDNLWLKSMRKSVFKYAKLNNCSYCQVYIECNLEIIKKRDLERGKRREREEEKKEEEEKEEGKKQRNKEKGTRKNNESEREKEKEEEEEKEEKEEKKKNEEVGEKTINNINNSLQLPFFDKSKDDNFEKYSIKIINKYEEEKEEENNLNKLFYLIQESMNDPFKEEEEDEDEEEKMKTMESFIHQSDILLRKLVSRLVREKNGKIRKEEIKVLGKRLAGIRVEILKQIKSDPPKIISKELVIKMNEEKNEINKQNDNISDNNYLKLFVIEKFNSHTLGI